MRFWITLVIGILAATATITVILVGSPGRVSKSDSDGRKAAQQPAPGSARDVGDWRQLNDSDTQKAAQPPAPRFHSDETERNVGLVERTKGSTYFSIANRGDRVLEIQKGYVSCKCADSRLYKDRMGPDESDDFLRLAPAESGTVEVTWDASKEIGNFQIVTEFVTNDPLRASVRFTTRLQVLPLVWFPAQRIFEDVPQDSGTEEAIDVFSVFRDDLEVLDPKTSSRAFAVRMEPLDAQTIERAQAKSGSKAVVTIAGELPVGPFEEVLSFETNLEPGVVNKVRLFGNIVGDIEAVPDPVEFPAAASEATRVKHVKIFAHGLQREAELRIGRVAPEFLLVSIEKAPAEKVLWDVVVRIPDDAPKGRFAGRIAITDQTGKDRMYLPVQGHVVDGSEPTER